MPYFKIAVLLLALLLTTGCMGTDRHLKEKSTLKVRLLFKAGQCRINGVNPQAIWIEDPDQFKQTGTRLSKHTIGAQQDLQSRVDFSREGILIVAMGQKPTGGYGLELTRGYAVVSGDAVILRIAWIEPPKGAMVPQMITHPCLAVILPKGPYSQIHLLDQDAHLRLQLHIK